MKKITVGLLFCGVVGIAGMLYGFWRGRTYEQSPKTEDGGPGRAYGRSYLGVDMLHDGRGGQTGEGVERMRAFDIGEIVLDPQYKQEVHITLGTGQYVEFPGKVGKGPTTTPAVSRVLVYVMEENDTPFLVEAARGVLNLGRSLKAASGYMTIKKSGESFTIKTQEGQDLIFEGDRTMFDIDRVELEADREEDTHIYIQADAAELDVKYEIVNMVE